MNATMLLRTAAGMLVNSPLIEVPGRVTLLQDSLKMPARKLAG